MTPHIASFLPCICSQPCPCSVCHLSPFLPHKFHHQSLEDSTLYEWDPLICVNLDTETDLNTQILRFPITLTIVLLHAKSQNNKKPQLMSKNKNVLFFHSIFLTRYMEKHFNQENQDLELHPNDAGEMSIAQNV